MNDEEYRRFFIAGSGFEPFPYQVRLACSEPFSQFLDAPTGSGKTLAVLGAWLWRRHGREDAPVSMPRRLVYCLPLRSLAGQTLEQARTFLKGTGLSSRVKAYSLMGGSKEEEWILHPEDECVIVGTQDMLLSRALNRGYAQSRFAWPRAFGLLNNDCLWVYDEVQLMSSGLETSAQLHGLRERFGTAVPCSSIWMSATMEPQWLNTPDFHPDSKRTLTIDAEDRQISDMSRRLEAVKTLNRIGLEEDRSIEHAELARMVLDAHTPGGKTLVVLNTVDRARKLFEALRKAVKKRGDLQAELVLAHSCFRPLDRETVVRSITGSAASSDGMIVVSTQVVEAGIDMTCQTLFTELAPWSSIVQRLGRCNRYGEVEKAQAFWIDLTEEQCAPYEPSQMKQAREILTGLEGISVSPSELAAAVMPPVPSSCFVLRARDLLDMFDTSPDLAGDDTDVSRFIREGETLDASIFWREFESNEAHLQQQPDRNELCTLPLAELVSWLKEKAVKAWAWDHVDGVWKIAAGNGLRPGSIVMLQTASGGYSPETGWDSSIKEPVVPLIEEDNPVQLEGAGEESFLRGENGRWVTLDEHSANVMKAADSICHSLGRDFSQRYAGVLRKASFLHDAGKASTVFQNALTGQDNAVPPEANRLWAKSGVPAGKTRYKRRYFRHELAGAMIFLRDGPKEVLSGFGRIEADLIIYLIASHHGRIRTSIRPMPGEEGPDDERRFACGVWDGDEIPALTLANDVFIPAARIDLESMEIGSQGDTSWIERMGRLRDSLELGPFRLACLEAVLRAADARASISERGE